MSLEAFRFFHLVIAGRLFPDPVGDDPAIHRKDGSLL
jgi:hypothetical protein